METIKRVPIVEQVMRNLQELIIERDYKPGDKMPTEKEVCEMFHVGRSTVREAYRMLQIMGVLESRQGSGSIVAQKISQSQQTGVREWFKQNGTKISDYMEVRIALEPTAASLAVQRATNKEINHIKEIHDLFCQAFEQNNALKMSEYDEAFHMAIAEASHNQLIVKMEKMISDCISDYRKQSFSVIENAKHAVLPHKIILDALCQRDPQAGENAVKQHLKISLVDMEGIINP